ncbi:hypothetical protein [Sediminibacterium ginsengisoli]|uniref:TonB dependent receptor n=1 Tax=Sediminibacterium ginsengisoli TaxID=413434 RepID=A0A1T4PLE3_9BACT|nr:hypothetical protein [Sediminibacterium ginsengisoli]SJZ92404.1 hypothetical protein SAMN04488132_10674 [Sediminibacterium ginsengisoli]
MKYIKSILLLLVVVCITTTAVEAQKSRSKKGKATKQQSARKKATTKNKARKKPAAKPASAKKTTTADISTASAQKITKEALGDTSAPRVVTITSAFKPSLKTAAKINFTAATPVIDSSRTPVVYNIPAQNLLFSYQPVPIKPVALKPDTSITWNNDHYVKLGVGNFSTLLAEGAFSFGDGKRSITNLRAGYLSNKGNLFAQQYSKFGVEAISILNSNGGHEWTTKAFYTNTTRYFYGYEPRTISYTKENLLRRYNDAGIEIGMKNKVPGEFNITYHPQLRLNYFSDNSNGQEYNLIARAPVRKTFGENYALDIGITADISSTQFRMIPNTLKFNNNLFYVSPSVQYAAAGFKLNLGVQTTWDNKKFALLPDITAEAKISDVGLIAEAGWKGYYNKNNYRSLADFNPWVERPANPFLNTKVSEQYGGIKGAAGNHFTYKARLSFVRLNNQPLFVNDAMDGKTFTVLFEPKLEMLKLYGEVGYNVQEKFSLSAGATYRQFTSLEQNEKAWGLLPLEINGSLRWKVLKDLQLKADAFIWDGAQYRNTALQSGKLDPAADLNIGAEFAVMRRLNLWLQLNNVLNNKYQRWNQYEVVGLNVLGGVVYSFR